METYYDNNNGHVRTLPDTVEHGPTFSDEARHDGDTSRNEARIDTSPYTPHSAERRDTDTQDTPAIRSASHTMTLREVFFEFQKAGLPRALRTIKGIANLLLLTPFLTQPNTFITSHPQACKLLLRT